MFLHALQIYKLTTFKTNLLKRYQAIKNLDYSLFSAHGLDL